MSFVTLANEKHLLVHQGTYATIEPPAPREKGIWLLHTSCGRRVPRGEFHTLGDRSKRLYFSCVRCARHNLLKERP